MKERNKRALLLVGVWRMGGIRNSMQMQRGVPNVLLGSSAAIKFRREFLSKKNG
jgi:hypothetical protein